MTVVLIDEGPESAESEIVLEYVRDQFAGMQEGEGCLVERHCGGTLSLRFPFCRIYFVL